MVSKMVIKCCHQMLICWPTQQTPCHAFRDNSFSGFGLKKMENQTLKPEILWDSHVKLALVQSWPKGPSYFTDWNGYLIVTRYET